MRAEADRGVPKSDFLSMVMNMTSRERLLAYVAGRKADRVPFVQHWGPWDATKARWKQEGMKHDDDWRTLFDFDPYVTSPQVQMGIYPKFEAKVLEDDGNTVISQDEDGVIKRDRKDRASMPEYLAYPVKNWKTWEEHKARFDPDTPGRFPPNWEEEKNKVRDFPGLVTVTPFPYGFFGGARTMMGAEECLIACALEPELIQDISETFFKLWYKLLERMLGDVRLDAIFFWEDMAGKQGSLISPAMFRQFMTPYYRKLIALGREHGVEMFSLDSDGNIHELTGLFLEAGINVVYPYEIQAGCDVAAMLRQYPGLCAMGGMDKRAMARDQRAMDEEIERVRGILSLGRYIPFPDHAIPPDVSWENYQYFVWRWKELVCRRWPNV